MDEQQQIAALGVECSGPSTTDRTTGSKAVLEVGEGGRRGKDVCVCSRTKRVPKLIAARWEHGRRPFSHFFPSRLPSPMGCGVNLAKTFFAWLCSLAERISTPILSLFSYSIAGSGTPSKALFSPRPTLQGFAARCGLHRIHPFQHGVLLFVVSTAC